MSAATPRKRAQSRTRPYARLRRIDGRHPFQRAAPTSFVPYRARRRHDTRVAYLNFGLAREMGLIPTDHPDRLTRGLRDALLETFGLVILNEYDYLNQTRVPSADLLPHSYMATRYLQMQHPDKRGLSSGDGRSIWNGCVRHRGTTWDVSSCGTGVTRLCPATSQHRQFFKTGNWLASYGCGTAAIEEGINAALMSEVFHRNGIATERVLAVIALPSGLAINVRAGRSLLRPSHFFVHLARDDRDALRETVDFFIDRMVENGEFPELPPPTTPARRAKRYRHFAEDAARRFARITARFESDYVFCWLDWDGDNILADGGIIDYGSVRQFGLYHRDYRFDDSDRFSTTIPEQRRKARHIVQKYAQIRDLLIEGERPRLDTLANDAVLDLFDEEFARTRTTLLLEKIGFEPDLVERLAVREPDAVRRFQRAFSSFERARSSRGPARVPDGINWNAVYCMTDVLRTLPTHYAAAAAASSNDEPRDEDLMLGARALLDVALSSYACRRDREMTDHRARMTRELQRGYLALVDAAGRQAASSRAAVLASLARRAPIRNPEARITGDAVDHATGQLLGRRSALAPESVYRLVRAFADDQDQSPERVAARAETSRPRLSSVERKLLGQMRVIAKELREGI